MSALMAAGARLASGAPLILSARTGGPAPGPEHVLALADDLQVTVKALAEATTLLTSSSPTRVLAGAVVVDLERARLAVVELQLRNLAAAMPGVR